MSGDWSGVEKDGGERGRTEWDEWRMRGQWTRGMRGE